MNDPNYWLPAITAGGTVVAAIITGFLAAALKHHWDVDADKARWERERSERRRDELKSAFARYLSSRRGVESAVFVAAHEPNLVDVVSIYNAQDDYFHSLAELQTVLDDRSFVAMEEEFTLLAKWFNEAMEGLKGKEKTWKPAPNNQSIIQLAQELIRD